MTITRAFIISFLLHGAAFVALEGPYRVPINTAVYRGPAGIDVSLVRSRPVVKQAQPVRQPADTPVQSVTDHNRAPEVLKHELKEDKPVPEETSTKDVRDLPAVAAHNENAAAAPGALSDEILGYLKNNPPPYPLLARMRGWEGDCVVRAVVSEKGIVVEAEVVTSSGHDILDSAAVGAIRKWVFTPLEAEVSIRIPVRFVIVRE
jgi:protein TonB